MINCIASLLRDGKLPDSRTLKDFGKVLNVWDLFLAA
jgi:hypothetical protein